MILSLNSLVKPLNDGYLGLFVIKGLRKANEELKI
jgi:hypothetical protein